MKNVTIGQYVYGTSILHRLDARIKLILTICLTILLFIISSPVSYAALGVGLFALIAISGIKIKFFLNALKPMVFIILFTAIVNLFFTSGETLVKIFVLRITYEGVYSAAEMFLRLVYLIFGTSFLTLTTKPLALTDGIESLLKPLEIFHIPASDIALMMTVAIRFIPTLSEEFEKIRCAQLARGANFYSKNLITRIKSALPVLIPLFVSAFNRADELASAMDSRCYNCGIKRTRMHILKITALDIKACAVFAAFFVFTVII